MSVVVFGGYGTFGSLVCRELARLGAGVTVAGRDEARARALARELGPEHRGLSADVAAPASCRAALAGHGVAVNAAGPFSALGTAWLEACLEAGVHGVDIADDRAYAARVRAFGPRFAERGLAAVSGCSSLPGLSEALAMLASEGVTAPPWKARVVLFIGNNHPKGTASVQSFLGHLGRPIAAPQGVLHGGGEPERVRLPEPFGERLACSAEAPDYDRLPERLGVREVAVKVGFENGLVTRLFVALSRAGCLPAPWVGRVAAWLGNRARWGSSGGAVVVDLTWPDGAIRRAALVAERDGQRMAALPAALVAHALATGSACASGARSAAEVLGPAALVAQVATRGFRLDREPVMT